jgi:hypothetical protein
MSFILFTKKDINIFKNWENISSQELDYLKKKIIKHFKIIFNIILENILLYIKFNKELNIYVLTFFDKLDYKINIDHRYKIYICGRSFDIINIIKKSPIVIKKYDDICDLENLPIILDDDYEVHIKDLFPMLLNKKNNTFTKLEFKYLYLENKKLLPLFYETEQMFLTENDSFLRVPYYDKKDKYAVILNRYDNGMNIMFVYIDIKDYLIYSCDLFNFTNPNGLAIEMIDKKTAKIFLSYKYDITSIYKNNNFIVKNKNKISEWYNLNIKREFRDVYNYIKFIKKYKDINIFEKYYEFVEKANICFKNYDYSTALNIYINLIDYPKIYKNYLFLEVNICDIYYLYYMIYLCYVELNDKEQSIYYFKKFAECFDDLNSFDTKHIIIMIENSLYYNFKKNSKIKEDIFKEINNFYKVFKIKYLV